MGAAESQIARPAFRMATMLWALGGSVLMALLFIALGAFAPELRGAEDDGAHALSRSAVGYAGLVRLLKETGTPVSIRRHVGSAQAGAGLLILAPPFGAGSQEVRTAAIGRGPVLIIAPKWMTSSSPQHKGWAVVHGLLPSTQAAATVARPEVEDLQRSDGVQSLMLHGGPYQHLVAAGRTMNFGEIRSLQTRASDNGASILQESDGEAVLVGVGAGDIFVLTDPDVLNNHGLADPDTARSALALVDLLRQGGPVEFDVTLNGFARSRSLLQTALTPPFFAATLCALIAFALIGWRALIRFGPVAALGRTVAFGKRALVDNAAGLIRLTRREARMAPRYAAVIRQSAARAVGAPRDWNAERIDAYLDRLGDPTGETRPFTTLVAAADGHSGDVAAMMRSAEHLFKWKLEIAGGR